MTAHKGQHVHVHYTGTFEDGTVFDSSEGREPLEFTLGTGQVVPGFDNAVEGMNIGDKKKVTLKPSEAYGDRDETLKREFPRTALPPTPEPKEGMMLGLSLPTGQQVPAKITKVETDNITIDLNHPLAGKTL
ncbi:MAG: peptidylprolyl isomerase, partial [Deltaproteobacteria bacterium]